MRFPLLYSTIYLFEQVNRIELSSSAWKADALTIVLYLHSRKIEINILPFISYNKIFNIFFRSKAITATISFLHYKITTNFWNYQILIVKFCFIFFFLSNPNHQKSLHHFVYVSFFLFFQKPYVYTYFRIVYLL